MSRTNPKDSTHHSILGTAAHKPRDFAQKIGFSEEAAWGVVKTISKLLLDLPEGQYVLLRPGNRPAITFYALPEGGLEDEEQVDVAEIVDGEESS